MNKKQKGRDTETKIWDTQRENKKTKSMKNKKQKERETERERWMKVIFITIFWEIRPGNPSLAEREREIWRSVKREAKD